jgi:hypothetical protein
MIWCGFITDCLAKRGVVASERSNPVTCPAECRGCPATPGSGAETKAPFEGWTLGWVSAVVFLVPLAMSLLGAIVAGRTAALQLVGATIGLVLGMLVVRLLAPRPSETNR